MWKPSYREEEYVLSALEKGTNNETKRTRKASKTKQQVKTYVTIGDSDFEFIVHTTVDDERASIFGNYVVNDVLLESAAYRPDRMDSALMKA